MCVCVCQPYLTACLEKTRTHTHTRSDAHTGSSSVQNRTTHPTHAVIECTHVLSNSHEQFAHLSSHIYSAHTDTHTLTHPHTFSLNLDDWVFSYLIGSAVSATFRPSFRSRGRISLSDPFPSPPLCISLALLHRCIYLHRHGAFFPHLRGKLQSGKEKGTEYHSKCHAVSGVGRLQGNSFKFVPRCVMLLPNGV